MASNAAAACLESMRANASSRLATVSRVCVNVVFVPVTVSESPTKKRSAPEPSTDRALSAAPRSVECPAMFDSCSSIAPNPAPAPAREATVMRSSIDMRVASTPAWYVDPTHWTAARAAMAPAATPATLPSLPTTPAVFGLTAARSFSDVRSSSPVVSSFEKPPTASSAPAPAAIMPTPVLFTGSGRPANADAMPEAPLARSATSGSSTAPPSMAASLMLFHAILICDSVVAYRLPASAASALFSVHADAPLLRLSASSPPADARRSSESDWRMPVMPRVSRIAFASPPDFWTRPKPSMKAVVAPAASSPHAFWNAEDDMPAVLAMTSSASPP